MSKRKKIVFFGSGDIGVKALQYLAQNSDLQAIVSSPDRPKGRGQKLTPTPISELANSLGIKLFRPEKINYDDELSHFLETSSTELFIVFAYSQFLSSKLLEIPRFGAFNLHTSLLPRYRGASPIQAALLYGDQLTGLSLQKMAPQMDAGDLAIKIEIPILAEDRYPDLHRRFTDLAPKALDLFFSKLDSDSLKLEKQDEGQVSYAPLIKKEEGHLRFKTMTPTEILSRLRAYDPWPGLYFFFNKQRLKVFEIERYPKKLSPGEVDLSENKFLIGTQKESMRVSSLRPEGGRRMTDIEWANGMRAKGIISHKVD